jgi:hypothetical protein
MFIIMQKGKIKLKDEPHVIMQKGNPEEKIKLKDEPSRKGQGWANKYETRAANSQSGGKTLYGFRIPFGSKVCFIRRIMPIAAGDLEK